MAIRTTTSGTTASWFGGSKNHQWLKLERAGRPVAYAICSIWSQDLIGTKWRSALFLTAATEWTMTLVIYLTVNLPGF